MYVMGIREFFKGRAKRSSGKSFLDLPLLLGERRTDATNATAFVCEKMVTDALSSVPMNLYQKGKNGSRSKAWSHPLYSLVKTSPNSDETPSLFFSQAVRDYFRGNVYINPIRTNGAISSLYLYDPVKMMPLRENGVKVFSYEGRRLPSGAVLHIPQKWSYDGLKGYSVYEKLAGILSASSSLENYTKKSFSGFIGMRLVMELQKLNKNYTDEELDRMRDVFGAKYGGEENAGKALLQLPDTKYSVLDTGTIDERVRWLKENSAYADERVAKMFGVPLPLLNGTYQNNIEAIFTVFIEMALRPIGTHFAESFNTLLDPKDQPFMYFEHDYNGLMKTDLAARIDAYVKQILNGILSPNQVLERENMPPMGSAGDYHFIPANSMPLTEENVKAYMSKAKAITLPIGDNQK
jgi:HK97 family phage portal protein